MLLVQTSSDWIEKSSSKIENNKENKKRPKFNTGLNRSIHSNQLNTT